MPIEFFHTHVAEAALREVEACLRSGRLSEGVRVKAFEEALTARLGLCNPVAVNSGTTALHLGLVVAGVGPGDEVIVPAQTFVATALAVLMQRASPVFCDIDPETGNMAAADLARRVTERTRAVMPVHWAGLPCDMAEIQAVADRHGLCVIEDAAHALGATYRGRPIGAVSRMTCFSFQAIKHLTSGDGGALCLLDPEEARHAAQLRWFGIDRARSPTGELGEREYDLTELGYKYHLNDYAAALALGNLTDFPARLARRRAIAADFRRAFAGLPGLRLLRHDPDRESAFWLFTVRVERRLDFIRAVRSRGVPASIVHCRIDHNTILGGRRPDLPGTAEFDADQVALPVHEGLSEADVATIIAAVQAGW
jgi:perosamine synthetase